VESPQDLTNGSGAGPELLASDIAVALSDADVVVDLTIDRHSDLLATTTRRVVTFGEEALRPDLVLAALLAGARVIEAAVFVRSTTLTGIVASSRVAVPRHSLRRSQETLGWRCAALLRRARPSLDGHATASLRRVSRPAPRPRPAVSRSRLVGLLGAGAVAAGRVALTRTDWRVAWGFREESDDPFGLPATVRTLTAPTGHFFADPFLASEDDRLFVFLEDFDLALGRASVAVVELGTNDETARTVLEGAHHFSYPFVFHHQSTWYMLPETASAGRVMLYRSTAFPQTWVEDTVLLEGVTAFDPTLVHRDGRWWLFYASGTPGSGFDDELHIHYGPSPRGPFSAHPGNPVRSDAVGARPAGRIVAHRGKLLRPGQNGVDEYGSGIVIFEIEALTPGSFRERETMRIEGPPGLQTRGIHTIDSSGSVVVFDTKHRVPRLPRPRLR
jgi:hypothetical protein